MHESWLFLWFGICIVIGLTSWFVVCPRCGAGVYNSNLHDFFRWRRDPAVKLPCYRCGLELKAVYKPGAAES